MRPVPLPANVARVEARVCPRALADRGASRSLSLWPDGAGVGTVKSRHSYLLTGTPNLIGEIMFRNWMRLTHDAVLLGVETQRVIGLRLMKLSSGGPAAQAEAVRMISEKSAAFAEAGMTLARGGSAGTVIRRYRTHVRSNKRRLSKS